MDRERLVSVCMLTYNHEKYIAQAIESVLMQKTNFDYELVIGEDCSLDKTREIIKKFQVKYPCIIKPIYHEKNVGATRNCFEFTFPACKGKYIALLEADDYWVRPYKLQKQVDFLEANQDFSICFHNAKIIYDKLPGKSRLFNSPDQKKISRFEDVVEDWYISTASVVFRTSLLKIPKWFKGIYNCDYALQLLLADKGPIGYLNEVMSVYRRYPGSFGAKMKNSYVWTEKIELFQLFNKHFNFKYDGLIVAKIDALKKELKEILFYEQYPYFRYFNMKKWIRKINRCSQITNNYRVYFNNAD